MDIDVIIFTFSALIWHIQWHELHLYIMGNVNVPWFVPIPPIGRQGTQKRLTNDLDDDNACATATTDVTIAVDNDAATASVEGDEGSRLL